MSATLGPSWNLRSNSSPRCLTAYITYTGGSSNNDGGGESVISSSNNPFDDAGDVRPSWSGDALGVSSIAGGGGGGNYVYSVAFGTERGSLHYRAYPSSVSDGGDDYDDGAGGRRGYDRQPVRDVSQVVIPPLSGQNDAMLGPNTGSSSNASVMSSMSHSGGGIAAANSLNLAPINLQGAVKGSIVGIVRARPSSFAMSHSSSFQSLKIQHNNTLHHHYQSSAIAGFHDFDPDNNSVLFPASPLENNAAPVFLLLVDDNRGSSSASSSNPGSYAAHLVTVKHGTFAKLSSAPANFHWGAGSSSSGGASGGNEGGFSYWQVDGTSEKSTIATGGGGGGGGGSNQQHHQQQQHRRGGSKGGSGSLTSWFGSTNNPNDGSTTNPSTGATVPNSQNFQSATVTGTASATPATTSLGTLPRMSCATYHPNTGFVYAAGTGVYGLQPAGVKAVLAGMMSMSATSPDGAGSSGGGGTNPGVGTGRTSGLGGSKYHSSSASVSSSSQMRRVQSGSSTAPNAAQQSHQHHNMVMQSSSALAASIHPPMALYLKCQNALPSPGVRCSSGGGSKNAMTLACSGRVAIVAVSNSFFAVPACLDLSVVGALCGAFGSGGVAAGGGSVATAASLIGSSAIPSNLPNVSATKLMTFAQSSQVHPVISMEVVSSADRPTSVSAGIAASSMDVARVLRPITSLLVLASGRECTSLEIVSIPDARALSMHGKGSGAMRGVISTSVKSSAPRHGITSLPSPILAAAPLPPRSRGVRGDIGGRSNESSNSRKCSAGDLSSGPLIALLTADGLVHIRSPFCVAVPLASIEVGTRPNDFFSLSALPCPSKSMGNRSILATSYGGEARLVSCQVESSQDFADRLIKLSIDAFGSNGFPRLELAEALGATFSATSYTGPEPTAHRRSLLRQYLESVLGLSEEVKTFMSNAGGSVSVVVSEDGQDHGMEVVDMITEGVGEVNIGSGDATISPSLGPNSLLTCTALLCLVCFQVNPPNATLANRAAKACASAMGTVRPQDSTILKAAVAVCELVADRLIKETPASFSLLSTQSAASMPSSHRPPHGNASMEFIEAAVWLLRSCGCHEKAIYVLQERMNNPTLRNASIGGGVGHPAGWSQIKFDSYIATHLGELWSSRDEKCCQLVLLASATRDLIARNPTLGLSIFTSPHPQNDKEWRKMKPADDPLAHPIYPPKVVELLKSVTPQVSLQETRVAQYSPVESPGYFVSFQPGDGSTPLPLHSGRSLAVTYLESCIGIATGRPPKASGDVIRHSDSRDESDERKADMHDELSYLLLEGVISERGDGDNGADSELGTIYRYKLRRLLSWPNSMIRSERLLASLPSSFLREHALLLGRLGRHEDALRIFYSDLDSLELALEYCDVRHERHQAKMEEARSRGKFIPHECAYLPLVRVALDSDSDSDRGVAAAIQVLALRRDSIDKGAALRLLPKNVPMSAVVRPFLIPAVVENESQVRRLTVASSLLRSRYVQLKQKLTEAQLKSQSTLQHVPALKRLKLGDPLYSSKPSRAKPVHAASPHFPEVLLTKHFFPRHLVIQAQVMNSSSQPEVRTLADTAFVIAESSDEALHPLMEVPLRTLPPKSAGSAWCVLAASPQRLDGTAFLTCELRFTVLAVDTTTGAPLNFGGDANAPGFGRTYVEELQDIEVRHTEFNP